MSSLFNKTTGLSLSSVLGGTSSHSSQSNNSSSISSNGNTPQGQQQNKLLKNHHQRSSGPSLLSLAANSNSNSQTSSSSSNSVSTNNSTKIFSEKLKLQQHQYALSTNNYLKTIDNCLEEASRTGDLLLAGKSLIEFPSTIAFRYDLTDTLTVDLSKNRLHELPKDILRYKPLEKLQLNANIIRKIPEIGVGQLKCIKILDLNCNRLTFLPASICNLVSLEILTVNNNKLVSLPEEIGRLDKLIQLDVSCNEVTHLPLQIGEMASMRALNVRRNLLVELPKEIAQLKLVSFDCSSNRITKLPLCFREMVTLIDLTVDSNPLELPPAHICTKGLLHIMKYLLVETIKEEKKRGVLSEYEINSQLNQLPTSNSNSTGNRRESCNSSTGLGSIGSFIFQSSVKNMNKKYNSDNISTQSTTASSSASTVSTSSSISTSSLSTQNRTSKSDSKSLSNTLLASGDKQQANNNYPFLNDQSTSKQNLFISNDSNDFVDPSVSSTSSPSSTTSSSPSATPVTGQSIVTSTKQIVSIHDLISPTSKPNVTSPTPQKFHNSNFITYNQSSEFILDGEDPQSQQMWRNKYQNGNQYESNFKSSSVGVPKGMKQTNGNHEVHYELYGSQATLTNRSIYRQPSLSSKTPIKPANSGQTPHQVSHNSSTPKSVYHPPADTDQIIYDEFLNPIVGPLNGVNLDMNIHDEQNGYVNKQRYHDYQQQQQQMIWVPRDDIKVTDTAHLNLPSTTYNANQHKPQYASQLCQQQQQTLSNGRELPAEMKNVDPAFTIRRHIIQIQEDNKQIETLRKIIDAKLNIQIPSATSTEELGLTLADGVMLCHLMNQIFPRAIQSIVAPSINMPKLSIPKCRKNVENFIEACHKIGIDEVDTCTANDIMEAKNTTKVARTVVMLVNYSQYCQEQQELQLNDNQYHQSYDIRPQQHQGNNACITLQQQQQTAV